MFEPDNAKLAIEVLRKNHQEQSEINKRTGDRTTIVLGATVTSFGLLIKLSDGPSTGLSLLALILSIVSLSFCFIVAIYTLFPKKGEQPGSTDIDFIWGEYVEVLPESAYANTMNDLCRVIRVKREIGQKMSQGFRCVILSSGVTLLLVALSEALAAAR